MEEREAANYQFQTTTSGSGDEDHEYERLSGHVAAADNGASGSQLGWTYVDYMKAAGLDPGDRKYISALRTVLANAPRDRQCLVCASHREEFGHYIQIYSGKSIHYCM